MISPNPFRSKLVDADGITDVNWLEFFSDVYFGIKFTQTSGTTAKRPTKDLFPGRFYFDTSLGANGKPIWIAKDGATWILADGTLA